MPQFSHLLNKDNDINSTYLIGMLWGLSNWYMHITENSAWHKVSICYYYALSFYFYESYVIALTQEFNNVICNITCWSWWQTRTVDLITLSGNEKVSFSTTLLKEYSGCRQCQKAFSVVFLLPHSWQLCILKPWIHPRWIHAPVEKTEFNLSLCVSEY